MAVADLPKIIIQVCQRVVNDHNLFDTTCLTLVRCILYLEIQRSAQQNQSPENLQAS